MQHRFLLLSLVLALGASASLSSGCTLLINGNQYVGSGTDGGMPGDGSMGDGSMGDGGDGGSGVNTPPVVHGVGLDSYQPMVGEALHSVLGPVTDADGDTTTVHYEWSRNGMVIAGMTSGSLPTSTFMAGDTIRVEAWANDGHADGPRVHASTTLLADQTRWRQTLPSGDSRLPILAWDAANYRIVRFVDGGVWEYVLEGDHFRITKLTPSGTAPTVVDVVRTVVDPDRNRLLVWSAADPSSLYALDLSNRGAEAWSHSTLTGTPPPTAQIATGFYDAGTHRAFWVGGFADSMGALSSIVSLDLSSAGAESWGAPTVSGDALPEMFGATAVPDPTTAGRWYLIGGCGQMMGASFPMRDTVLQLDVTSTTVQVTQTSHMITQPFWGGIGITDPTTHVAILYGGFSAFLGGTLNPVGLSTYDPATGAFATVGTPPTQGSILGTLAPSATPDHYVAATVSGDLISGATYISQFDVTASAATVQANDDRPNAIAYASASAIGSSIVLTGGTSGSRPLQDTWSIDPSNWRWRRVATMDDTVTHHSPQARFGMVNAQVFGGRFTMNPVQVVGGALDTGLFADMSAWEIGSDGVWIEHVTSGTTPTQRTGGHVFPVNCGGSVLGVFGGVDATNNYLNDIAVLDCPSGPHACTWSTSSYSVAGRRDGGIVAGRSHAYILGGLTSTGPTNEILAFNYCYATPMQETFNAVGSGPSMRSGLSFTAVTDVSGTLVSALAYGGEDAANMFSDTEQLVFTDDLNGQWSPLNIPDGVTPPARSHHVAVYDSVGGRLIVIGGARMTGGSDITSDVWELRIRP